MRFTGNRKWPALTVLGKNVADFVELLRGVIRLMDNKLITSFPAFFVQCVETGKEIVKAMSSSNDIIKLVKAEKTCQIDIRSIRRSIRRFLHRSVWHDMMNHKGDRPHYSFILAAGLLLLDFVSKFLTTAQRRSSHSRE